jgi:hypothetical protein
VRQQLAHRDRPRELANSPCSAETAAAWIAAAVGGARPGHQPVAGPGQPGLNAVPAPRNGLPGAVELCQTWTTGAPATRQWAKRSRRPVFGLGIVARAPTGRVESGLEIDQQKRGRGHWRCTGLR